MKMHPLDLTPFANAHAATFDADRAAGCVNIWGNSFPAEEVPFGRTMLVGGVVYHLPDKLAAAPDHIEALGQRLAIETTGIVHSLGVLGFGELGAQSLSLTLTDRFGTACRVSAVLPNWLLASDVPTGAHAWRASHLHYVGGYELDQLRPTMSAVTMRLPSATRPLTLTIEPNPLAHVVALTLLYEDAGHA